MTDVREVSGNVAGLLVDRHIAATRGDKRALAYDDKRYTFRDIAALMNRAGNMLKALGVAAGDQVLVIVPESPAFFAAVLGAMKIGAVPVIVPDDAVAGVADYGSPSAVVVHSSSVSRFQDVLEGISSDRIVVVGQDPGAYQSFLELVREAASSLGSVRVEEDAPALARLAGTSVRTISHAELRRSLSNGGAVFDDWPAARALGSFARCEEVTIAAG